MLAPTFNICRLSPLFNHLCSIYSVKSVASKIRLLITCIANIRLCVNTGLANLGSACS